jgi:hypothetical protein
MGRERLTCRAIFLAINCATTFPRRGGAEGQRRRRVWPRTSFFVAARLIARVVESDYGSFCLLALYATDSRSSPSPLAPRHSLSPSFAYSKWTLETVAGSALFSCRFSLFIPPPPHACFLPCIDYGLSSDRVCTGEYFKRGIILLTPVAFNLTCQF